MVSALDFGFNGKSVVVRSCFAAGNGGCVGFDTTSFIGVDGNTELSNCHANGIGGALYIQGRSREASRLHMQQPLSVMHSIASTGGALALVHVELQMNTGSTLILFNNFAQNDAGGMWLE
jgi:hypothetical protein